MLRVRKFCFGYIFIIFLFPGFIFQKVWGRHLLNDMIWDLCCQSHYCAVQQGGYCAKGTLALSELQFPTLPVKPVPNWGPWILSLVHGGGISLHLVQAQNSSVKSLYPSILNSARLYVPLPDRNPTQASPACLQRTQGQLYQSYSICLLSWNLWKKHCTIRLETGKWKWFKIGFSLWKAPPGGISSTH